MTETPAAVTEAPFLDTKLLRNALGTFPTGVAIITTLDAAGRPVGLTCNSFSSVSLDPPLVSWGLRLSSRSLETFREAGAFAINILAEDQRELSNRFASSTVADKFEGVAHSRGHRGLPLLDGAVATFECDSHVEHLAGDHALFIGKVANFAHRRQEGSLVFYKGAYMMLTRSLSELAAKGRVDPANLDQARRMVTGALLELACQNGTEADFDAIERNIAEIESLIDPQDRDRRAEAGLRFFQLIAEAAHNDVLVVVSDSLTNILRQVLLADVTRCARLDLVPIRKEVLRHLRNREPEAAQQTMQGYFDEMRRGSPAL